MCFDKFHFFFPLSLIPYPLINLIGQLALIVVPFPEVDSIAKEPPESSVRSLILVKTQPFLEYFPVESRTIISIIQFYLVTLFPNEMRTRSALLCFAILFIASCMILKRTIFKNRGF